MQPIIAIQPDDYTKAPKGAPDAASPRWAAYLESQGCAVRWVDVYRADILEQLSGCHGFMWRWAQFGGMGQIARRLLPALEHQLRLPVYPDQRTCWHYDDKIAQSFLLPAAGIPTPKTWVWFSKEGALAWLRSASFPLVLKLSAGAGSVNVRMVRSPEEATSWTEAIFDSGIQSLEDSVRPPWGWRHRLRVGAKAILTGRPLSTQTRETHRGYVLFQEFLPDNAFDTRITVIGHRAFGYRRNNRPGDFRASGSGLLDHDPKGIDPQMVRLGFEVARRLDTQSVAVDGLYRRGECVVGEVSYTFISGFVHACPGHWTLDGDPQTGRLNWHEGQMWPEEAQAAGFLERVHASLRK